nr:MFS transporter [Paenibacillus senegalimassiliensis]
MERLWTKSFMMLTASMLLLYTGFYSLLPVLPLHIEQMGATSWQIGAIVGMYTLSAVICRPYIGHLLDTNGRRKYMVLGIIFFAFFMISYSWTTSLIWLVILRVAHGASWGLASTALGTAITDCIPEDRKGEGMAWYGLSMTIAMATGPLLGAWMVKWHSVSALFLIAAMLSLLPLLTVRTLPSGQPNWRESSVSLVWSRSLKLTLLAVTLLAFSFGGVTTYMPLYLAEYGASASQFFMIYAATLSLARPLAGLLINRCGERFVIASSLAVVILSLFLLGLIGGAIVVGLSAAFYGLGFGMAQPALQTLVLHLTGKGKNGMANALFFTAFDTGIGVGSVALGLLSVTVNYGTLFIASGLVVLIGYLLFLGIVPKKVQI